MICCENMTLDQKSLGATGQELFPLRPVPDQPLLAVIGITQEEIGLQDAPGIIGITGVHVTRIGDSRQVHDCLNGSPVI